MSELSKAREDLVIANRVLANEGILDAFGHVSVRHPEHPDRYIMSWARSPELIEDSDLLEFALDGTVLSKDDRFPYLERFIHGAIYEARPDVCAVCHNHTLSILPFSISRNVRLRPVIHTAASLGGEVPVWDIADEFGSATDLLVRDMEQGRSLSRALGQGPIALMRGHGSVVAGADLFGVIGTCIGMDKNAKAQLLAQQLGGDIVPLSQGEIEVVVQRTSGPASARAWEYWKRRAGV
jgi:ribulose-5-phosphate 4-epimerase/fuculose-1-phosphate aldolase